MSAKVKDSITMEDIDKIDIGYADGIVPVLAQPEREVPNGTRVG